MPDLEDLAGFAYRAYNRSLDIIPDRTYETLPEDQKEAWQDVAMAILIRLGVEEEQKQPIVGTTEVN